MYILGCLCQFGHPTQTRFSVEYGLNSDFESVACSGSSKTDQRLLRVPDFSVFWTYYMYLRIMWKVHQFSILYQGRSLYLFFYLIFYSPFVIIHHFSFISINSLPDLSDLLLYIQILEMLYRNTNKNINNLILCPATSDWTLFGQFLWTLSTITTLLLFDLFSDGYTFYQNNLFVCLYLDDSIFNSDYYK